MKVNIPLMIQDPATSLASRRLVEGFWPDREQFLLDGPVSDRIAVLDFCPDTGKLLPGARLVPSEKSGGRGHFTDTSGKDVRRATGQALYEPAFLQVSAFATVLRTLYLFEEEDTLGRRLTWAFGAPQLLVVPRAGQQANAYYHRDSHSLQFFFIPSPVDPAKTIYTSLSRDIVAHETGHAIVDGIVPHLFDASTPQSLAIHEAAADLTALLMAFDSGTLREEVLEETRGSIAQSTAFTSIAEEFGTELWRRRGGLRELNNRKSLDKRSAENYVGSCSPHDLSQVLSGALYGMLIDVHDNLKARYAQRPQYRSRPDPAYSASGYALFKAAKRFRRMLFRALDWLPNGEATFADLGRAMIAVDKAAFPESEEMRSWIGREFVNRGIVGSIDALATPVRLGESLVSASELVDLYRSDWHAFDFVNRHRELLCIPPGVPFEIPPRLRVRKEYDYETVREEYILKVAWEHIEPSDIGPGWPAKRRIAVGTTLVLDSAGKILAWLSSAPPLKGSTRAMDGYDRRTEYEQQRAERDRYLSSLAEAGTLQIARSTLGPDGQPLLMTLAESVDGAIRMRGTANLLHIVGGK